MLNPFKCCWAVTSVYDVSLQFMHLVVFGQFHSSKPWRDRYACVETRRPFETSRTRPVHSLYSAFVFCSSCVYGCWCERLRPNLKTIHGQNGLVSLYIDTNHNSLNDTSFRMVHMMCDTQTHQHPTSTLLCQLFNGRCQSRRSAQLRNVFKNVYMCNEHYKVTRTLYYCLASYTDVYFWNNLPERSSL